MLGHNVQAVAEFYTHTAKMPGKCPVSDLETLNDLVIYLCIHNTYTCNTVQVLCRGGGGGNWISFPPRISVCHNILYSNNIVYLTKFI